MTDEILDALDEEQREVVLNLNGPVCVLAGAGTGKTRAMTHRIAYGVKTGTYAPEEVLAVTFTSKAAGEMRIRLRQLNVQGVNAKTFHAEALSQLRHFWPKITRRQFPDLVGDKESLVEETMNAMRLETTPEKTKNIQGEIEWAKVSLVSPKDYPKIAEKEHRNINEDLSYGAFADIMRNFEKIKLTKNQIDFEDCLLLMSYLIGEHENIKYTVRSKYKHFIVDEYQDVSPLQQFMLSSWLGKKNNNLCVVGDPSQTIYSFAGATPYYLLNFTKKYEGAKTIELYRDYRSTPQVVHLANRTLQKRKIVEFEKLNLISNKDDGMQVHFSKYLSEKDEAQQVAIKIKELVNKNGLHKSDIAILYRQNVQANNFRRELNASFLDNITIPNERFFTKPVIKNAINKIKVLSVTGTKKDLSSAVFDVLYTLGMKKKMTSKNMADREIHFTLKALYDMCIEFEATQVGIINRNEKTLSEMESERKFKRNSVLEFLEFLNECIVNQVEPKIDAVTLSSLHAAKGLEWKAVFLVGLYEGSMPIARCVTDFQIEEERRLLYVGITRAKDYLYLSFSKSKLGGKINRKRTCFLDGIWRTSSA
jgi:DNA helicase-2/ATP-dependent DNA helicase PcrA